MPGNRPRDEPAVRAAHFIGGMDYTSSVNGSNSWMIVKPPPAATTAGNPQGLEMGGRDAGNRPCRWRL